jgi:hypothetical protein
MCTVCVLTNGQPSRAPRSGCSALPRRCACDGGAGPVLLTHDSPGNDGTVTRLAWNMRTRLRLLENPRSMLAVSVPPVSVLAMAMPSRLVLTMAMTSRPMLAMSMTSRLVLPVPVTVTLYAVTTSRLVFPVPVSVAFHPVMTSRLMPVLSSLWPVMVPPLRPVVMMMSARRMVPAGSVVVVSMSGTSRCTVYRSVMMHRSMVVMYPSWSVMMHWGWSVMYYGPRMVIHWSRWRRPRWWMMMPTTTAPPSLRAFGIHQRLQILQVASFTSKLRVLEFHKFRKCQLVCGAVSQQRL